MQVGSFSQMLQRRVTEWFARMNKKYTNEIKLSVSHLWPLITPQYSTQDQELVTSTQASEEIEIACLLERLS